MHKTLYDAHMKGNTYDAVLMSVCIGMYVCIYIYIYIYIYMCRQTCMSPHVWMCDGRNT